MSGVIWTSVLMVVLTIVFLVVLSSFASRVLGVRIGLGRLLLAGALGLGLEVGFESRFVWGQEDSTLALLPLQIGIIFLVSIATLVIAELLVPTGSIPRPDQWLPSLKARVARTRRYTEISRIAFRSGLIPFRPNSDRTAAGSAERTKQARALRSALESAGGAFVKLGQLLSTRTDLLPPEFLAELSQLQQRVPPAKWTEVRALLKEELGGPVDRFFTEFNETPLAAASIGQVHRATLLTGELVAVKVQRPRITPLVERDLDITLRLAAQLERTTSWGRDLGIQALVENFAESLREELDYRVEASNISAMAITQAKHPEGERVGIPRHYPALCTGKVFVMELVVGETLSDPRAFTEHPEAERIEQANRLLRSTLTQIIEDGVFHSDLHPGNIILRGDGEIVLLDFGSIGRLDSELRAQIGEVLLAFYRGDSGAFADALLGFVELPDEIDETALRRQLGVFVATKLGPGSAIDVTVFQEMMRLLTTNRIAVPAELATAFRAIATLEGTLRHLSPDFDMLSEASGYAADRVTRGFSPKAVFTSFSDELASILPIARRLPKRIDQLTGTIADGRLKINMRLFADRRDRDLVRSLVNLIAASFLAAAFGIMAAMMLVSTSGPEVTEGMTLFQVFGYLLVVLSGILTLRVLFDLFRIRPRE